MTLYVQTLRKDQPSRPLGESATLSGGFKGGPGGAIAPGPVLRAAKRGPTTKKKDKHCKEQGPSRCFWPWARQSLKPPLATLSLTYQPIVSGNINKEHNQIKRLFAANIRYDNASKNKIMPQ